MNYTKFTLIRDINGFNGFGLPFALDKYSAALAQSSEKTLTVPSLSPYYVAIFSYQNGSSVWVANNATAAAPASSSFSTTTSELNPTARLVKAADVLHFLTADSGGAVVGVTFYALPNYIS